uniref:Putative conserved secreted protein n=1 Tax=Ixodes scapularis TaxID=6945 RepID=A0A4D5S014_IXOSC
MAVVVLKAWRLNNRLALLAGLVLLHCTWAQDEQRRETSTTMLDYCVIGAGPSGLQMAYFLQQSRRNYLVFEKSNMTGHFFSKYPKHRQLISINKRHTGQQNPEFNLRHDWNSLLSHEPSLLFKHFSQDYYPHADTMPTYLEAYRTKLGLKVQFDTEVTNVQKLTEETVQGHRFSFRDQRERLYLCKVLIAANGMSKPNIPTFAGSDLTVGYEDVSTDIEDFEAKTVLVLGRGNSAFETANHISSATNYVHLLASSPPRFAWSTHYVGDLRAINNDLLDHYQLKSLDGLLEADLRELKIVRTPSGKIAVHVINDTYNYVPPEDEYDTVIRCLGFTYDDTMFTESARPERGAGRKRKFPLINGDYESANVPGMYFVGAASHSLDFRKAAGGFIHGFRYAARVLHRLLEFRYHGVQWPSVRRPLAELVDTMVRRINEASGIYQMHNFLSEVVIIDRRTMEFEMLEEYPLSLVTELTERTGRDGSELFVVVMKYHPDFSGPRLDTFHSQRSTADLDKAHLSNFLHPVIYYYKDTSQGKKTRELGEDRSLPQPTREHHVLEDFLTRWTSKRLHVEPLRKFLESCLQMSLRQPTNQCTGRPSGRNNASSVSPGCAPQSPRESHFTHTHHASRDVDI